jgi:Protein of unknown function (DUF2934)
MADVSERHEVQIRVATRQSPFGRSFSSSAASAIEAFLIHALPIDALPMVRKSAAVVKEDSGPGALIGTVLEPSLSVSPNSGSRMEPMNHREQQVRERAYYLWEAEGRPHGRAEIHWAMAEIATAIFSYLSLLEAERAGRTCAGNKADSTPSSDVV